MIAKREELVVDRSCTLRRIRNPQVVTPVAVIKGVGRSAGRTIRVFVDGNKIAVHEHMGRQPVSPTRRHHAVMEMGPALACALRCDVRQIPAVLAQDLGQPGTTLVDLLDLLDDQRDPYVYGFQRYEDWE